MPNIPTYDAGELQIRPSEAGSSAFREEGGVATHLANAAGEQYRQMGRAIGRGIEEFGAPIEKMQKDAQAHTDAMAEIEFQKQLTNAEIAAKGGVDLAGAPKDAQGNPISENPGRGAPGPLPQDASVPSPDQYGAAAKDTIEDHSDFLNDYIDRVASNGQVSPRMIDHMREQANASSGRLAVHAAAVAGEVAYAHATHSTEQTINGTLAAVRRGDMSLTDGMAHIDGALNALGGSLSGDFAGRGSKFIEDTRTAARQHAIVASIEGDLIAGRTGNALKTLNDPKWDADIGGVRQKIANEIHSFQSAQVTAQEQQRKLQRNQEQDAALARTDQYVQDAASGDPKLKLQDIWTDPAYNNRPDLRKEAVGVFETMRKFQTGDLNVSPQVSHTTTLDLMSRMTAADGDPNKITDRRPIDQAFIGQKISRQDYTFLLSRLKTTEQPFDKMRAHLESAVHAQYKGALGIDSLVGTSDSADMQFYRWQHGLDAKIKEYKASGNDPSTLLNPSSPDYFGSPQVINSFKQSMQQRLQPGAGFAAVRTNNPGAQYPSDLARQFGMTGYERLKDGNLIAKFPTPVHGAAANMALLNRSYVGMTVADAESKWSGGHRAALPGFSGDTVITEQMTHDPNFMIPFMKATANAETPRGANALSEADWQSAFKMYKEGGAPPVAVGPPRVSTAAEYAKLSVGARYMAPDGSIRVKGTH